MGASPVVGLEGGEERSRGYELGLPTWDTGGEDGELEGAARQRISFTAISHCYLSCCLLAMSSRDEEEWLFL